MLALQIILCVLIADFIVGLVHWWEDAYGLPSWPVLGKLVVEPNIQHHENPTFMVRAGTFASRNVEQVLGAAFVCGVAFACGALTWQLALVAAITAFGNEVHAWTHGAGGPIVRLLQEMAVVQTPQHHAKHHRAPYACRFCVMTNWLNPILDRLRFWAGLEWCIACAGVQPKRMSAERRGV